MSSGLKLRWRRLKMESNNSRKHAIVLECACLYYNNSIISEVDAKKACVCCLAVECEWAVGSFRLGSVEGVAQTGLHEPRGRGHFLRRCRGARGRGPRG
ncbi:PP20 [Orf virus]|uniref:PP20 n=1 Tax=Orf virus TaxID=10258 RepID=F1AXF4_ORFV|nr:PP20 [Orf virus]